MGIRAIKIYGERNSGTNYLEKLIERNLDVRLLRGSVPHRIARIRDQKRGDELVRDLYFKLTYPHNLGWKHALVEPPERLARRPAFRRPVGIVTVTKDPYSWSLSIYRRPYHNRARWSSFEEFLSTPWPTVGRENAPEGFVDPTDMWNQKNASYLIPPSQLPIVNLRYQDLLADPQGVIERIRLRFALKARGPFVKVEESTKGESRRYSDYRAYYLEERWRGELSPAAAAIITSRLDMGVASALGFTTLSATTARRRVGVEELAWTEP
jgi:hypothetical protein